MERSLFHSLMFKLYLLTDSSLSFSLSLFTLSLALTLPLNSSLFSFLPASFNPSIFIYPSISLSHTLSLSFSLSLSPILTPTVRRPNRACLSLSYRFTSMKGAFANTNSLLLAFIVCALSSRETLLRLLVCADFIFISLYSSFTFFLFHFLLFFFSFSFPFILLFF